MTKQPFILVVEDEEDISNLIQYNLEKAGYHVLSVASGEEALKVIFKKIPDLILLDIMLPGMDGLELCRSLRKDSTLNAMPIIMITAKGEEHDIVKGLELGADDYITKPFSPKVLKARIQSVLRRKSSEPISDKEVLNIHAMTIHPGRHEILVDGRQISFTRTEFQIIHFLAKRPGWVFSRYQIVDGVKGEDYPVTDRAIDVTVVGIRKKLGNYSSYIETVRGVGYRFAENP